MKHRIPEFKWIGFAPRALVLSVSAAILLGAGAPVVAESAALPTQNLLADVMSRQQQMQTELNELRGLVEQQGYELEMLKRANKEAYADTDQRIRALDAIVRPQADAPTISSPAVSASTNNPQVAPTVPSVPPAPSVPVVAADDQVKYDQGLKLLRAGQYEQAIKTFDAIIKSSPPSANRPNALYWTGEAYVVQGNLKAALGAFEQVVRDSPAHQKAADAQLKIGYIYYDQKNYARAKEILNKVKAEYPGTHAATLAEQRLKRMQAEGV